MRSHPFYYFLSLTSALFLAGPFLFPVLFPLSWVSLVPLLWLIMRVNLRQAFFFGWLTGVVTTLMGFYWLNYTIGVFGGFAHGLSELILLVFAVYTALPVALFALLVRLYGLGTLSLFPALVWVTIEFWFPLLFPWYLANSQSYFLPLIQSADLVGPYGTSFLLVWVNTVLFKLAQATFASQPSPGERKFSKSEAAVVGAVLVGVLIYGTIRLESVTQEMKNAPALTLAAVQGNIDIRSKGNITYLESNLKAYKELTQDVQGASLVIWPESAIEAWLPENLKQLPPNFLPSLSPDTSFFLFGVRSMREEPASPGLTVFNSAFLVDRRGRVMSHYHKQVLLAFGEYIPLVSILSKLPGMPPIGKGFTPGDGPRTLDLSSTIKLAPLICYEDLMPQLSRRFVAGSQANLLINLTNDAWFGNTLAPWQHARLGKWRAIETRRSLVRATNAGLTAIISPTGKILQTIPPFSSGILTAKVPLMEGKTPYVRFGDWFSWIATAASLSLLIVRRFAVL